MMQISILAALVAAQFGGGFQGPGFAGQGFPDQGITGPIVTGPGITGPGMIPGQGIVAGQGAISGQTIPIGGIDGQVNAGIQFVETATIQPVQQSQPAAPANGQIVRERGGKFRNSASLVSSQLGFFTALLI
jgi:hypothetical protein